MVYAGDDATVWTFAFATDAKTDSPRPLAIASAVVDFGDGTAASVSQACTSPSFRLRIQHGYAAAGGYVLAVRSAMLCDPGWELDLESEGIRALPAAPLATADWPPCTRYQLKVSGGGTGAGLGNVATLIRLTNESTAGCSLTGYPGLQLVSADRSLLPTHVHLAAEGDYMFPSIAAGRVALAPGQVAAFEAGYTDNPSGSADGVPYAVACPPARWVRVIFPQTHQWGAAKVPMAPCGGAVNVSPIFPGGDWIGFPGA